MSTRFAGTARSGISPVTLVIFILLFIVSGIVAFVFYAGKVKVEMELNRVGNDRPEDGPNTQLKLVTARIDKVLGETMAVTAYLENKNDGAAVKTFLDELDVKGLVVEPKDFRTITSHLDMWILHLARAEADLQLRIQVATAAAGVEETARDGTRDAYNRRVQDKNAELRRMIQEFQRVVATKEALVKQYHDDRKGFKDRWDNAHDEYERRKLGFLKEMEQLTRRNSVVRRDLRVLRPEPSIRPPAGHVVRSDWQTNKAVIDLGQREHVFPGLVLEVYSFDRSGQRVVKGKLDIMTVFADSSLCNVIESDARSPIVGGDMVQTRMLPVRPGQKFVIAGFISSEAPYDRDKLKAIIQLNGGVIQDSVGLGTDCLILGETGPRGLGELDRRAAEAAPDEARRGLEQAEIARELSVDILDYTQFVQGLLQ